MKIYIASHNSGPSWQREDIYIDGIFTNAEKASEIVPEQFRHYEVTLESQYNNAQDRHPIRNDKTANVIRHWMVDGWWWSVSEHEVIE